MKFMKNNRILIIIVKNFCEITFNLKLLIKIKDEKNNPNCLMEISKMYLNNKYFEY
jgi:hypothetical protein